LAFFSRLPAAFLGPILILAPGYSEAQSLAASLGQYESALHIASVAGISAKSFSGAALHPETGKILVVDNDNANLYELSKAGLLQRTITTSGFLDPEAISHQGQDYFLVAEEGLANIVRVQVPRTGTGPIAHASGSVLNLGANMGNSGIEGVAYCAAKKTAYAVKETDPARLYRISLDAEGKPLAAFPNEPFSLEKKSGDAADLYALGDGNFIVVNHEDHRLEGYDSTGKILSTLDVDMDKPEGLAIDLTDGTLYVVGEPLEFRVFKRKATPLIAGKPGRKPSLRSRPCGLAGAGLDFPTLLGRSMKRKLSPSP
jgi:uncharacterized protein YjiK